MPIKVNYIDGGIGIEFISLGRVTGKEIIEANEQIYTRENLLRIRYKVIDKTRCTEYIVSVEDIQNIANQDKEAAKINPNIVVALVSTTPLQYGMSRMWEAYVDETGLQTGIFKNRESADTWLRNKLMPVQ